MATNKFVVGFSQKKCSENTRDINNEMRENIC